MDKMLMGEESGDTDVKCLPTLEHFPSLMTMTIGWLANNKYKKNKTSNFRPEMNFAV